MKQQIVIETIKKQLDQLSTDMVTKGSKVTEGKVSQSNVKIDTGVKDQITDFLETNYANTNGYTSIAQVVTEATREWLDKRKRIKQEIIHFTLENADDRTMSLDLDIASDIMTCNVCDATDCKHIKRVYKDKQVSERMRKRGIRVPDKK